MPASQMRRVDINLDNSGLRGVKLSPCEIAAQQKQGVAIRDGVITRIHAKKAGHSHVEGVVVFDEVFGARCMGKWRFEPFRQRNQLLVCPLAARPAINGNFFPALRMAAISSISPSLGRVCGEDR